MDMPQDISALGRAFDFELHKAPAAPAGETWIEWNGGAIPVDLSTMVRVQCRDGKEVVGVAGSFSWGRPLMARGLGMAVDRPFDIVRYRLATGADGWTEWAGNTRHMPAKPHALVAVRKRVGLVEEGRASDFVWSHDDSGHDIIAFREIEQRSLHAQVGLGEIPVMKKWQPAQQGRNEQLSYDLTSAPGLLTRAKQHLEDRAATYNKPEGERSMGATVAAFNIITGRDLTESEGWLLMQCLKMVRDRQRDEPHRDSIEDNVAYAALYGEARLSEVKS